MAQLTKGIKLWYAPVPSSGEPTYVDLGNPESIPDLGGTTDSVEITDLGSAAHTYMNGLKNFGDSCDFVFVYDATKFKTLAALSQDTVYKWKVELPNGTQTSDTCTFDGYMSVKLNGATYNEAMKYTLSVKPSTAMTFTIA